MQVSLANLEGKSVLDEVEHLLAYSNEESSFSALGVPIGSALLIDGLRNGIPKFTSAISPEAVIRNGPLNLQSLTTSTSVLYDLREAYAIAISHVNIFLVVLICISVPTACGMKWLNIKDVSRKNEEEKKMKRDEEKEQGRKVEQDAGGSILVVQQHELSEMKE